MPAAPTAEATRSAGPRGRDRLARFGPLRASVAAALLYLPFIGLGYGTDVDSTNVLRSGASLLEGTYRYSRPPGALPYEALVGAAQRIGGPLAINLASTVAAVATLALLGRLIQDRFGRRAATGAVVVLATQPWFWVAATSLGDYLFALGFLLGGIALARTERRSLAALCFATAIGFRAGTVLLIASWFAAELTGDRPKPPEGSDAGSRWARARSLAPSWVLTAGLGALWFVPSWLSVGRTNRFLLNEFQTSTPLVQVGRWGIKNIAFFGPWTMVVLALSAGALVAGLRCYRSEPLVRFALFAAFTSEALFLRFPWKPVHLLPAFVAVVIVTAAVRPWPRRLIAALVAANLALAVVSVTIAEPDVVDAATTGRFHLGLTRGVVLNDIDCRLHPRNPDGWPPLDDPEADFAAIDAFTCQARSWRADPDRAGQAGSAADSTSSSATARSSATAVGWSPSRARSVSARDR